ncbi:uncharacterized protein BJX67DRAFT_383789 [Aspergillus lucknowensis]|uniref:Uncharacterized protein n=1 Tax=Aspergillus lucknowensis TaxID=176173 RepID=A0ABR4LJL7_9EURO
MSVDTTSNQNTTQCTCSQTNPAQETPLEETPSRDAPAEEEDDGEPDERRRIPRRGRDRRPIPIRPRRIPRAVSRYSSRSVSPGRSRSPPGIQELVSSYNDLFPAIESTGDPTPALQDRFVILDPFNREAYIATHPASPFDFSYWLPLLSQGSPDTWYSISTPEATISASVSRVLSAPPRPSFRPLSDPRPVGLKVPRLSASTPLRPSTLTHVKADAGTTQQPRATLIYLSIQQSITGYDTSRNGRWVSPGRDRLPDLAGRSATGQNIYRVVRTGSREEAAAQAFYHAGGNRWSTIFTCVVVGGKGGLSGRAVALDADGYERVASLEDLIESDGVGQDGKIKVFY